MLSKEFVESYQDKEPPFGGNGFGHFVYLRTYSRWLADKSRREHWYETVHRVVEYSMSLYSGPASYDALVKEAKHLYDNIFNLRFFPSGRTLWVGGTPVGIKYATANYNCAFVIIDNFEALNDLFYLLLVGCGVGFRVLPKDIDSLPKLNNDIVLANKPYHGKEPKDRIEETLVYEENDDQNGKSSIYIVCGDSKEAWVSALDSYIKAMQRDDVESIMINYDSIRPRGEALKTFGGRASGHQSLKAMIRSIHNIIIKTSGKLQPIDILDIANHIGKNVVVGGVRRTSQIALFDLNDSHILDAKVGLYAHGSENFGQDQRAMSNNSIVFKEKPTKKQLLNIFERIQRSYEPGFFNFASAEKRRPWFEGTNPCGEILLSNNGLCNLCTINMCSFLQDGIFNKEAFFDVIRSATRVGLRMTTLPLELSKWDAVQKRDRLLGVSLSGIVDVDNALGWADDKTSLSDQMQKLLQEGNAVANNEAIYYAKELRVPTPLLVTTIKPDGTLAKLPTVSNGAHRSRAPYYIRRVRITSSDPLARVALDSGFPVYPENNSNGPTANEFDKLSSYERMQVLQKANTWVIEFPVASSTQVASQDEPAIQQFDRYLKLQRVWTDHNTSITIQFSPEEVSDLIDNILSNWDDYIGVSFMAKDTNIYPLLPEEPISEEEYNRRSTTLSHITNHYIVDLLTEYEREDLATELLDADCVSGACPVR